ncbi:MAG: sugar transferase [Candidatus Hydrogenedentes bacterium]|nr:sugar transferase [Candidatus Hydrogenedentota bacterium]
MAEHQLGTGIQSTTAAKISASAGELNVSAGWQVHTRRRRGHLLLTQRLGGVCVAAAAVVTAFLMENGFPDALQSQAQGIVNLPWLVLNTLFSTEFRPYAALLLVAPLVQLVTAQWLRLYTVSRTHIVPFGALGKIFRCTALITAALYVLGMAYEPLTVESAAKISGLYFIYVALVLLVGMLLVRSALLIGLLALQIFDFGRTRVAVLGFNKGAQELISLFSQTSSEYNLSGIITCDGDTITENAGARLLGPVDELDRIINESDLDELIIAADFATLSVEQRQTIAQTCWQMAVDLRMVAPFYPAFHTEARTEYVGSVCLLNVARTGLYAQWPQLLKRAMDIFVSLAALLVLSPLMVATALMVKLDSPGPIIFRQKRVGLNGRVFNFLKFRSMRDNNDPSIHQQYIESLIKSKQAAAVDKDGKPIYKIADDPRITRFGKFIRKLSIDELPQLINVLRGEMSLVGPRPPLPYEVEQYEDWHYKRLLIRPGITGLWQVGGRSRLSYDEMIRLDVQYIENWSLWLDVQTLFKTVPVVLRIGDSY